MSDKKHLPIDDAPEHAAALGRLIAHWNALERILVIFLQWLLGTSWFKALLVFHQFSNITGKIYLLKTLNYQFNENEFKNEIDRHLNTALALNEERNKFIHALWGVIVDDKIVRVPAMEPCNHKKTSQSVNEQFSSQDIQEVVDKIARLSQSLSDITHQMGIAPWKPIQINIVLPRTD